MDTDDIENPFGDGVGDRGVDDDDENIPLISTSSCRGSEDTTYHRTYEETSFTTGGDEKFHEKKTDKGRRKYLKVNFQIGTQKILHLMLL